MAEFQLNHSEREAIRKLKELGGTWPKSLWLYSASGTLWVMRKVDGKRMMNQQQAVGASIRIMPLVTFKASKTTAETGEEQQP